MVNPSESSTAPEESPVYLRQLQAEIRGIRGREHDYFELEKRAEMVLVVGGCDDSRQGVPEGLQAITWMGENETGTFCFCAYHRWWGIS